MFGTSINFHNSALTFFAFNVAIKQTKKMIGSSIGNYKILEKLSEAENISVYKAVDEVLDRFVFVKVLNRKHSKQAVKNFRHEAEVLAKLVHPCVPTLHTLTNLDNRIFMISEFLEGETLSKSLRCQEKFSYKKVVLIFTEVLNCLEFAHTAGIAHGNLTTADIFLTKAGEIKILNFGKSENLRPDKLTGEIAHIFERKVNEDVYAVGKMLFETLSGESLSSAEDEKAKDFLCTIHPDIPAGISEIICKILRNDRNVPSVAELREELLNSISDSGDLSISENAELTANPPDENELVFSIDFSKSEKTFSKTALKRNWSKKRGEVQEITDAPFNWKLAQKNVLVGGAGIFGIVVLHFFFQFFFFQEAAFEKDLTRTEQIVEVKPYSDQSAEETAEPFVENTVEDISEPERAYKNIVEAETDVSEIKSKKNPSAVKEKTIAPSVQVKQKVTPPRNVTRKKGSQETRAERLKRAEKLLTGV